MRRNQQPQPFAGDPFARQCHQIVRARHARRQPVGIDRIAEARMEAEEAQDPQMILGDPLQRITDEAHAPGRQIVQPAEIIEDLARSPDRHRARSS